MWEVGLSGVKSKPNKSPTINTATGKGPHVRGFDLSTWVPLPRVCPCSFNRFSCQSMLWTLINKIVDGHAFGIATRVLCR